MSSWRHVDANLLDSLISRDSYIYSSTATCDMEIYPHQLSSPSIPLILNFFNCYPQKWPLRISSPPRVDPRTIRKSCHGMIPISSSPTPMGRFSSSRLACNQAEYQVPACLNNCYWRHHRDWFLPGHRSSLAHWRSGLPRHCLRSHVSPSVLHRHRGCRSQHLSSYLRRVHLLLLYSLRLVLSRLCA